MQFNMSKEFHTLELELLYLFIFRILELKCIKI